MLANSRHDAACSEPSLARTFTLLELGPFADSAVTGVGVGCTSAAEGGGLMIAAGLAGVGAGATFAGWAGGFVSPPLVDRHEPMSA